MLSPFRGLNMQIEGVFSSKEFTNAQCQIILVLGVHKFATGRFVVILVVQICIFLALFSS